MTTLTVRPADAYAVLRVIADAARAAADVVLEENVVPAAQATGASTFTTPFGKVYTSTTEAHVEILSSADLRAWLVENLPVDPRREYVARSIIAEHQEDTFDEHQLDRATRQLVRNRGAMVTPGLDRDSAREILRAAFPPRTVPEKIAEWVIPYLTQRAKIVEEEWSGLGEEEGTVGRLVVVDSETGEIWPWATAIPKKVTWSGRFDKEKKAETTGMILDQVSQFAVLVGVKEIDS